METVLLPRCCQESSDAGLKQRRAVCAVTGNTKLRSLLAFACLFVASSRLGCTNSFNHLSALRESMGISKHVPLGLIYTAPRYHTTKPHLGALVKIEQEEDDNLRRKIAESAGESTPVDDVTLLTEEDDSIIRNTLATLAPVALVEVALMAVIAARMHGLRWPAGGSSHDVVQAADNPAQIATTAAPPKSKRKKIPEVDILLVSSSPRWIAQGGDRNANKALGKTDKKKLLQLPGRDAEMRMMSKLDGRVRILPAAVFPSDVRESLGREAPQAIILSGHFVREYWLSEADEDTREVGHP